jgi:molecular chaperone GrpE (heat shock protein)
MKKNTNQTHPEKPEVNEVVEETAATQAAPEEAAEATAGAVDYETKFNELNDQYLRLMAEFDSYSFS